MDETRPTTARIQHGHLDPVAKGIRRSDCITCNGENNRTRYISWEEWLDALLSGEPEAGS
jgi:hypothetical protein